MTHQKFKENDVIDNGSKKEIFLILRGNNGIETINVENSDVKIRGVDYIYTVSYTHLTLQTNREV